MHNLYNAALEHYDMRQLGQSEALLRQVLAESPNDLPSVSLLGVVLLQSRGPTEETEAVMRKAVELSPDNTGFLNNLGSLYWAQKKFTDAQKCFLAVTRVDSGHYDAWHNLGNTYAALGQIEQARAAYDRALKIDEKRPEAANSLALFLHRQGNTQDAIEVLLKSISLSPDYGFSHGNLGLFYQVQGRQEEAIGAYQLAIEKDPRNANYHLNLSQLYYDRHEWDKALAACRRAIILDSKSAAAYNNLGSVLRELGQPEQALSAFSTALQLDSKSASIYFNLGAVNQNLQQYTDARENFEQAVVLSPDWPSALMNLASMCVKSGDFDDAIKHYSRAIKLDNNPYLASAFTGRGAVHTRLSRWQDALADFEAAIRETPDHPDAHFANGILNLKLGRFNVGWREYEWRFAANSTSMNINANWHQPEWDGSTFRGKTLLVHHEQGLGDAIHFIRYLPGIKELGGKVILRCGPPLFRLFESVEGIDERFSRKERSELEQATYDLQVPLMSVPHLLGTRFDSIPADVPYLTVDDELVASWRERAQTSGFKVGLVWEGNPDQGDNNNRSCRLDDFAPLADVSGVTFYSLQVGEASAQAKSPPAGMEFVDFTDNFTDMADTAALIKNLDLVITIDTSVAHLAGALGHPVWVVLWTNCCWRYLLDRNDSPWYPTMRLFRQHVTGDWTQPIQQITEELARITEYSDPEQFREEMSQVPRLSPGNPD
ncbi:MAG: hypothetical protein DHS20C01_12270 [marine bacterium B5-7]|nr:MAG: hypothetical protein DHS20C01_12270 [marine bacterium B5-7]